MKRAAFVLLAVMGLVACKKEDAKPKPAATAPITAGTVRADGTRQVPIAVKTAGYEPATLQAKANEKLVLVFTRVEDTECGAQVKVADGKVYDLPLNTPVEIAVTAPASGQLAFACGMDMMAGSIVIN